MNCQGVIESVTAAVDGVLPREIAPQFEDHIAHCPRCRAEYELERATKALIRIRVRACAAPSDLRQRISAALESENPVAIGPQPLRRRLFTWPAWQMMLAAGGVAITVLLLFAITPTKSHHNHSQPADGNIIHQTYNNFDRILDGKIVPQVASSDPAVVEAYIQPRVNFHVKVPRMKRYTLMGGNSSLYQNRALAHIMYRSGHDFVYLYQVRYGDVLEGTALNLPPDVIAELKRTGWYFENHSPDCSLAIWLVDSSICCAIADVKKDELLASLLGSE